MVTITIDEATLNATRAALDERVTRLEGEVTHLQTWDSMARAAPDRITLDEDAQRALVWNIAALHQTKTAQEFFADLEPGRDHPEDATWTNREGQPEFNGAFR